MKSRIERYRDVLIAYGAMSSSAAPERSTPSRTESHTAPHHAVPRRVSQAKYPRLGPGTLSCYGTPAVVGSGGMQVLLVTRQPVCHSQRTRVARFAG